MSTQASSKNVGPAARKKLSSLIKYYMKKPHPFTACVRDNTKRFGPEGAKKVCATLKDIGEGTTKWRKGGKKHASMERDWAQELYSASDGNVDGLLEMWLNDVVASFHIAQPAELGGLEGSAVEALQNSKPLLTTVPNVQIMKTGIEYPLSTGPATFTPEDLASAVEAQSDPAIPQPRIWIGHPDDPRIHGERSGGTPSGEPAIGKVTSMRLIDDGNTIVGDLTGVPIWLANIMGSAFPSRSIEGRFNVKTPTGNHWRLVINGLALLGVVWPGVLTLEDIPTLYTEKGPEVEVKVASEEQPFVLAAAGKRTLVGQVTVEDLRRAWYDENKADPDKRWWWLRCIYLQPNELIVDADDGGSLYRQPFTIKGEKVTFGTAKKVKIKYVNASHGGVEAEPVNPERQHVALFNSREESYPEEVAGSVLEFVLGRAKPGTGPNRTVIEVKLGGS